MTVTRAEVADVLREAFTGDVALGREQLLQAAVVAGARPAVLAQLEGLSSRRFHRLPDLWAELGALPIEKEEAQ